MRIVDPKETFTPVLTDDSNADGTAIQPYAMNGGNRCIAASTPGDAGGRFEFAACASRMDAISRSGPSSDAESAFSFCTAAVWPEPIFPAVASLHSDDAR